MKGRASLVPTLIQLINVLIGTNLNSVLFVFLKTNIKARKVKDSNFTGSSILNLGLKNLQNF